MKLLTLNKNIRNLDSYFVVIMTHRLKIMARQSAF